MEFKVSKISGLEDAMVSLLMSKKHYTDEARESIKHLVDSFTDRDGFFMPRVFQESQCLEDKKEFEQWTDKLVTYGLKYKHEVILRFIDITIITTGLHRAGQDDLDSHAMRMSNRIVRTSTRYKSFKENAYSEFYRGRIMSFKDVIKYTRKDIKVDEFFPEEVIVGNIPYSKTPYGYVLKMDLKNQDVLRGLYPLSIASDCIWKCNYVDLRHIYNMRGYHGRAHEELKCGIEMLVDDLSEKLFKLGELVRFVWGRQKKFQSGWVHVDKAKYCGVDL